MNKRILRFALAVVVLAALVRLADAQVTDSTTKETLPGMSAIGVIEGRVVLPSGRSVNSSMKVTLEVGGNPIRTVYTDTNGEFHIRDVAEGLYNVKAYGDDRLYDAGNQEIRMQPGANARVMIYLKEKARGESTDSAPGVVSARDWDNRAPKDAKKAFDKGQKMIDKGQVAQGVDELKHAVSIYPDYASARNALGVQYLKHNQLAEASDEFLYILQKAPTYFDARFNLGLVRLQQRQFKDAAAQLSKAASIDSSNPACHMWLGVALLETSDLRNAEMEINRAQILGGHDLPATHYYIGQVYLREGRQDDACKAFAAYVTEAPKGFLAAESQRLVDKCQAKSSPPHQ